MLAHVAISDKNFVMWYRLLNRYLDSCWIKMAGIHLHLMPPLPLLSIPLQAYIKAFSPIIHGKPINDDIVDIPVLVKGYIRSTTLRCHRLAPMFYGLHISSGTYLIPMLYMSIAYWTYSIHFLSHMPRYCYALPVGDRVMLLMRYILYIYVMYVLYRYLYIIIY